MRHEMRIVGLLALLGASGTAWAGQPEKPPMPPAWDAKALETVLAMPRWRLAQRRNWDNDGRGFSKVTVDPGATVALVPGVGITVRGTASCWLLGYGASVPAPCGGREAGEGWPKIDAFTSINFEVSVDKTSWKVQAPLKADGATATFEYTIPVSDAAAHLNSRSRDSLKASAVSISAPTLGNATSLDSAAYAKTMEGAMLDATSERIADGWVVRGRLGATPLDMAWPGAEACGRFVGMRIDDPAAKDRELMILSSLYREQWDVAHLKGDEAALKAWRKWLTYIAKSDPDPRNPDGYSKSRVRGGRSPEEWLPWDVSKKRVNLKDDDVVHHFAFLNYLTNMRIEGGIDSLFTAANHHVYSWNSLGKATPPRVGPWNSVGPTGTGVMGRAAKDALDAGVSTPSPLKFTSGPETSPGHPKSAYFQFASTSYRENASLLTEAGRRNAALPDEATCGMGNTLKLTPGQGLPLTMKSSPVEVHVIDWPAGAKLGEPSQTVVATSDVPVMTLFE